MSKVEFITPEGYRKDGRTATEVRAIQCKFHSMSPTADGAAYFEIGNTRVLCYVYGPCELKKRKDQYEKGRVICELTIAAYSTTDRKLRSKYDRLTQEYALLICHTFNSVITMDGSNQSKVYIYVHILQIDGGARSAAVNACCLALVDAGIPMRELVTSCSSTVIDGKVLTDPNSMELNAGKAELCTVLHGNSRAIESVELTSKLPLEELEKMLVACSIGCQGILEVLQSTIRETSSIRYRGIRITKR